MHHSKMPGYVSVMPVPCPPTHHFIPCHHPSNSWESTSIHHPDSSNKHDQRDTDARYCWGCMFPFPPNRLYASFPHSVSPWSNIERGMGSCTHRLETGRPLSFLVCSCKTPCSCRLTMMQETNLHSLPYPNQPEVVTPC